MRFEAFIAARYLRGKRKNRFVNLITVISIAGVSVGVIALIVVMSVMTGFDIALRDTIIGNRAHLNVFASAGGITDWKTVVRDIEAACPEIVASGPITQVEALFKNRSMTTGGLVLGVDIEREKGVTDLAENLTDEGGRTHGAGALPREKEIVLGYRLAKRIGAIVGDEINIITAKSAVRPFFGKSAGSQLFLRVSGISEARMSEFDSVYGYVSLETARMLTGEDTVDAVHVKLKDPFQAEVVAKRIEDQLHYRAATWYDDNMTYLEALRQEKLAMFVILAFIILVAAFNITSTLIMIVMEKRRDIGILRTLGASGTTILGIFILEGLFIGLSGTLAGLIGGILLAENINPVAEFIAGLFGMDLFNSTIYLFDGIPVAIVPMDVFWVTFSAVALTFLSTLYPAWSASRVNPVDALRYE